MYVLFVNGISDNSTIKVSSIAKDGKHSFVYNGGTNLFNFINLKSIKKQMLILDANNSQDIEITKVPVIFNEISDADSHKMALSKLNNIEKILPKTTKILNHPKNILNTTRDSIYNLLKDINQINVPKTIKIKPTSPNDIYSAIKKERLQLPVIFRQAGDHGGISTILLEDEKEQFYSFALDSREFYLTQFVDYIQDDIYTKYRLIVIDGEVYLRHVIFSDNWMIHSGSRTFMENNPHYQQEEANTLKSFDAKIKPMIQDVILEIKNIIGLDYFGIDCSIDKDFNITIFELNANMNVLLNTSKDVDNIWEKQISVILNALTSMILKS